MSSHYLTPLIERAKEKSSLAFNTDLSTAIGMSKNYVSSICNDGVIPKDTAIVRLCRLADADPVEWLYTVKVQHTEGEARQLWRERLHNYLNRKSEVSELKQAS